jgi:hypothetical protein
MKRNNRFSLQGVHMRYVLPLIVAALLTVAGCGLGSPREITSFSQLKKVDKVNSSLLVAPLRIAPARPAPAGQYEFNLSEEHIKPFQFDLFKAVLDRSFFPKVEMLAGLDALNDESAFEAARRRGLDYVLTLKFDSLKVGYKGTNGKHVLNCVLWFLLEFFSWCVADENYGVDAVGEATVTDVAENKVIYNKIFQFSHDYALNDFERGVQIWGILRVPGSLDEDSWADVASSVLPHMFRDIEVELLVNMQENRPKFIKSRAIAGNTPPVGPTTPPVGPTPPAVEPVIKPPEVVNPPAVPQSYALIIGISKYSNQQVPELKFAASDADKFAKAVVGDTGNFVPEKNAVKLAGENATKAKIVSALDSLASKSDKELDAVYIYFAGHGASDPAGDEKYLVAYDSNPSDLKSSAVSLSWLMTQLSKIKTDNVFVMIDAGFAATGGGRSLKTGAENTNFSESLLLSFVNFPGVFLVASKGAETAFELEGEKCGMFTHYFFAGFSDSEADADSDGKISLKEAWLKAQENVGFQAKMIKSSQSPDLHGKKQETMKFPGME